MGYNLQDIIARIEEAYPLGLKLEWDNPGLLVGHRDKEIDTVYVALDADEYNITRAVAEGAGLILTHHPIIFGSIRNVSDDGALGRKLIYLIEHDVSVYSMHTNFDIGKEGMADAVARRIGAAGTRPLMPTGEADGCPIGVGFVYDLPDGSSMSSAELADHIKQCLGIDGLIYYDASKPIRRIAVCPGSGHDMSAYVLNSGADAYIAGDMSHHEGLDYKDAGVTLIDAGHFGTEHIFTEVMSSFLRKHFPMLTVLGGDKDERIFI